jgi:hypothetical protein
MVDVLRIKRRPAGGAAGPPASLAVGELAFNEQDAGLYIGKTDGSIVKVNSAGGGGSISIADTAPGSPTPGAMWWESDTGKLWIYYNDGTSSQWVLAAGSSGTSQAYVDAQDALKVAKAGDTMTGDLTMNTGTLLITGGTIGTLATNGLRLGFGAGYAQIKLNGPTGSLIDFSTAGTDFKARLGYDAGTNALTVTSANINLNGPVTIPTLPLLMGASPAVGYSVSLRSLAGNFAFSLRVGADGHQGISFLNGSAGAVVGSIVVNAASTVYNTTSDGNLKEDLRSFDAGPIIDATCAYDFRWKSTGERAYGVVAQQAIEVHPTAVSRSIMPDETEWWGIDYSKYVPVLLQELKALRARVAALEAR